MIPLELRGISVGQLVEVFHRGASAREIVLTTDRKGVNVLHWGDCCQHGTNLSRPCFNCGRGGE